MRGEFGSLKKAARRAKLRVDGPMEEDYLKIRGGDKSDDEADVAPTRDDSLKDKMLAEDLGNLKAIDKDMLVLLRDFSSSKELSKKFGKDSPVETVRMPQDKAELKKLVFSGKPTILLLNGEQVYGFRVKTSSRGPRTDYDIMTAFGRRDGASFRDIFGEHIKSGMRISSIYDFRDDRDPNKLFKLVNVLIDMARAEAMNVRFMIVGQDENRIKAQDDRRTARSGYIPYVRGKLEKHTDRETGEVKYSFDHQPGLNASLDPKNRRRDDSWLSKHWQEFRRKFEQFKSNRAARLPDFESLVPFIRKNGWPEKFAVGEYTYKYKGNNFNYIARLLGVDKRSGSSFDTAPHVMYEGEFDYFDLMHDMKRTIQPTDLELDIAELKKRMPPHRVYVVFAVSEGGIVPSKVVKTEQYGNDPKLGE